jgi:hypothetical protein
MEEIQMTTHSVPRPGAARLPWAVALGIVLASTIRLTVL